MNKQMNKSSAKSTIKTRVPSLTDEETVLAEIAGIDGSHWQLCLHLLSRNSAEWQPLQVLSDNAGGVNPFYEPSFLIALRGKMIRTKEYHLIVWEKSGESRKAKLAFPVFERKTLNGNRYLRAFENEYAPLATPLVDVTDSKETISRFCQLLQNAVTQHEIIFRIESLCMESVFAKYFLQTMPKTQVTFKSFPTFVRAGLHPVSGDAGGLCGLGKKRTRELKRLENKLAELGTLQFECVTDSMDTLLRFEEFLLLEMKGWKGRKGTSMQMLKKTSAFARQAITDLASQGKCEIFSLRLDTKSIATIIVFKSDGRYYPWKIAFDEAYANRSPGSVLMHAMSKEILLRPDFKMADSLAKPGTSWMTNIWHDTLAFSEVVIGPDEASVEDIAKSGKLKSKIKQLFKKLPNSA